VTLFEDLPTYQGNYGRIDTLDELKRHVDLMGESGLPIAFDVETGYTGQDTKKASLDVSNPHQFVCGFSFTTTLDWARYVPLKHDYSDNLDPHEVWPIMKPLLESATVVAHNWVFEARNLRALDWKGDGPRIELDWSKAQDTMIQSYVLGETQRHGLKELSRERFGYAQAHIDTLFEKATTAQQRDALRFNVLDVNEAVLDYVCDDVTWSLRLDAHQRTRAETERKVVYQLEREILGILVDMAEAGIAVDWDGINLDHGRYAYFYAAMEARTRTLFEQATDRDLTALNFRSPIQMRKLLFEDMGLHSSRMTKPNKDGDQSLSTDETALEALRHQHPAIEQLLQTRRVKKMGEWFEQWSGLRTSVDERVHPSLNQVRVQSGRFASDAPNIQNITKKWFYTVLERDFDTYPTSDDGTAGWEAHVKEVGTNGIDYWAGNARDFLVASPGYRLLSFDYATAEMRVLAGLSGEPHLLNAFATGVDVHATAASLAFGVPLEQIGKTHPLRQRAKAVNFGLIYGQGPQGLADGLGISKDEAQLIMDQYFSAFSKVDQWFARVKNEGKRQGYVTSWIGRRSTLWDLQSPSRAIQSKADRMMVNIPVQGGAADYCKLAMIKSKRRLVELGWWGSDVRMLMNQHDSLVFEVAEHLDLHHVRDELEPCVSFPVPAFPSLPLMEVDWDQGYRWGSVQPLLDGPLEPGPKVSEVSETPARPELHLVETSYEPTEVVLSFAVRPTPDEARALSEALKAHPGEQPVYLVVGDREVAVPGKHCAADDATLEALRALSCRVSLRKIA
jgi:DNA polymerase-1